MFDLIGLAYSTSFPVYLKCSNDSFTFNEFVRRFFFLFLLLVFDCSSHSSALLARHHSKRLHFFASNSLFLLIVIRLNVYFSSSASFIIIFARHCSIPCVTISRSNRVTGTGSLWSSLLSTWFVIHSPWSIGEFAWSVRKMIIFRFLSFDSIQSRHFPPALSFNWSRRRTGSCGFNRFKQTVNPPFCGLTCKQLLDSITTSKQEDKKRDDTYYVSFIFFLFFFFE